jgi:hypothetical protein
MSMAFDIGRIQPFDVTPLNPATDAWGRDSSDPDYGKDPYIVSLESRVSELEAGVLEDAEFTPREDAKQILAAVLIQYGLQDLSATLWDKYAKQEVDFTDADALVLSVKDEPAYKKRFRANELRKAAGLSELLPSTYIELEKSYSNVLAKNGLPAGFYDDPADFEKLIGGDVAITELDNRLRDAYRIVEDADETVKQKLRQEYNLTDGDILAYFIDPDRARPLLTAADYKRQAQSALFMGRAQTMGNIGLSRAQAEELVRSGVTLAEAETGFQEIGKLGELRTALPGEAGITDQDLIAQQFGLNEQAKRELEQRKKSRIGEFVGGGEFTRAAGDTAGSIVTGIGRAQ